MSSHQPRHDDVLRPTTRSVAPLHQVGILLAVSYVVNRGFHRYIRQGGYVFIGVCLFVSGIVTQKLYTTDFHKIQ